MFKLNKYLTLGFVLLLWVGCQSCFQFRSSERKQLKSLGTLPDAYTIDVGYRNGADRLIHYTWVWEDSTKPLAVFIHGSPGSSANFIHFAKDTNLLSRYDVLLLDRPGFGYSGFGSAEPSMQVQSQILRDVVRQFPHDSIYLVGHSLGGPIICRMAMDDTTLASGLVVVAGSISPALEPNEWWRKPLASKAVSWLMPKSFRVSNTEILPAEYELNQMTPLWPRITIPVQVLQGDKDNLVPPGNADYAKQMLTHASSVHIYIFPELNHFIPFSQPELVVDALLRF